MLLPEKFPSGLVPALEMGTLPPDVPQTNNRALQSLGPGESHPCYKE